MSDTHFEAAEIAALDEDLLPPSEADRLRAHLARCASCTEIRADLAVLRDELGALPDPGPVPADVAARIDTALAAAAEEAAVSRETSADALGGTGVAPGETAARETAGSSAMPAGKGTFRWLRLGLAAVGAVVVLGMGAVVIQSLAGGEAGETDAGGSAESSVQDFDEDTGGGMEAEPTEPVEDQVQELLDEAEGSEALVAPKTPFSPSPPPTASDSEEEVPEITPEPEETFPSPESTPVSEVPPCVEMAIGRAEEPLAAGEEDYEGIDAYLVVFPDEADPEQVDAYIVDASCTTASPSGTGEILLQESYPRG